MRRNYTKEQILEIVSTLDLSKVDISDARGSVQRSNSQEYKKFLDLYPDLVENRREFMYWAKHYKDSDFVDSQFCSCGTLLRFGKNSYRRYCSSSCAKNSKEVTEKTKKTCLERYGVENPSHVEAFKEKAKKTCLERYGAEYTFASEEVKAKLRKTNMERYGSPYCGSNKEVIEKAKKTCLERYGENYGFKSEEFKVKARKTNLKKYGCENVSQKHIPKVSLEIISSKEKLQNFIQSSEIKSASHLSEKLEISISNLFKTCHKYGLWDLLDHYISSYELEIQEMFPNAFIKTRKILNPYEIDLYSEEYKFGIEFNGDYWHSEQHGIDRCYHQKKSLIAEKKGIFLYHIWEYEWKDSRKRELVISQLRNLLKLNKIKIHARKCEIRKVPSKEARKFLEENHIQGYSLSLISLGLYYQNELVSIMTFGKPRFDRSCEYELIRFCNKKNTSIAGSAQKIFKHFLKEFRPISILSYSHIDKGTGKLYENLGFKLDHISDPGYVWTNGKETYSRYQCQKHKLLEQGFEGNSEKEIMESRGFLKLYDCGNKVWKMNLY